MPDFIPHNNTEELNGNGDARLYPMQRRMLDILRDGLMHRQEELEECMKDDLRNTHTIHSHVSAMRKYLRPIRDVAIIRCGNQSYYQIVRYLRDDE